MKQEYIDTGKVYYVFKDYPIKQLHPQAHIAAQAAECAGEQGKYWEMHDALFVDPKEWDTTEEAVRSATTRYAGNLALEATQFARCMEPDSPAAANVAANIAEAQRLGLTGTPAFVINGKLLAGAQPLDVFQRVYERELESVGAPKGNGG